MADIEDSKDDAEAKDAADQVKPEPSDAASERVTDAEAKPSDEEAAEEEEGEAEKGDAMSPEAIAKRVNALGEEDEGEKIAREEEEKLAARRAKLKKKKKGGGLEGAASKRLAKIGTKAVPARRANQVATAVDADPLMEKAAQFSKWAKANVKIVGTVAALAVLGAAAFGGYLFLQKKKETDASAELSKAVADERGRVGDPDKDDDPNKPKDPSPIFKTSDARRESALAKYRDVETRFPGTGAAFLARLSEGSILLDKREPDKALEAYNDVKNSALAQADAEVKGRALEGSGFAYELKAQAAPAEPKHLEDAIKAFRELESTDVKGFKELGMYHQARVYESKGDKDKAKELLKSLWERVNKPGDNHPFPYLQIVTEDRLRALDPTALPPKQSGALGNMGGGASGKQMNEAQIKQLIEQMQKNQKDHPGEGAP
ncbi:MAG: putative lipoprotein [Myxococcaceae bacterium]|nr:putative lipoprotein [Myxococcaceae bacterium]